MKISITLLTLATLFHTTLGVGGDCNFDLLVCETDWKGGRPRVLECKFGRFKEVENCKTKGKVCVQPAKAERRNAFCGDPSEAQE